MRRSVSELIQWKHRKAKTWDISNCFKRLIWTKKGLWGIRSHAYSSLCTVWHHSQAPTQKRQSRMCHLSGTESPAGQQEMKTLHINKVQWIVIMIVWKGKYVSFGFSQEPCFGSTSSILSYKTDQPFTMTMILRRVLLKTNGKRWEQCFPCKEHLKHARK